MKIWLCTVPACNAVVPLGTNARAAVQQHLVNVHNYSVHPTPADCMCGGCLCSRQGTAGDNCPGRTPGHAWHGTNVLEHVWKEHLEFRDVCQLCGKADFVNNSSYNRHVQTCTGRVASRCKVCMTIFPSKVALGGHVELGLCPYP